MEDGDSTIWERCVSSLFGIQLHEDNSDFFFFLDFVNQIILCVLRTTKEMKVCLYEDMELSAYQCYYFSIIMFYLKVFSNFFV